MPRPIGSGQSAVDKGLCKAYCEVAFVKWRLGFMAYFELQSAESDLQQLAEQYWQEAGERERELEKGAFEAGAAIRGGEDRSEERRVGKECRYRWSPYH